MKNNGKKLTPTINLPPKTPDAQQPPAVEQHIALRHITALMQVQAAAQMLLNGRAPETLNDLEKVLYAVIQQPILQENKEAKLLQLVHDMLVFVLPGADIPAQRIGIVHMQSPDGQKAISLNMQIQPDKAVAYVLPRKEAEIFEAGLTKHLNEHFGRLIEL